MAPLVAAALPSAAQAADPPQTYVASTCGTASGWTTASPEAGRFDRCAIGDGFGLAVSGRAVNQWRFEAPSDLTIAAARIWRSGASTSMFYGFGTTRGDVYTSLETEAALHAPAVTGLEYGGLDAARLVVGVDCFNVCAPATDWVKLSRVDVVLRDAAPPRGTLTTARGGGGGTIGARVAYADSGGGVRDVALLIDGAEAARTEVCASPYRTAVPCPVSGETDLEARGATDGAHRVAAAVTDVAGNRTVSDAVDVVVPGATVPAPRAAHLTLAATRVRSAYTSAPLVRATLRASDGTPVADARVEVAVRAAMRDAAYRALAPAFSDAKGMVTVRLPKGTSRVVRLSHGELVKTVNVVVKAPLRLTVTPRRTRNRGVIRLRGTVPGTTARTRVELQALSGGHWFPFRTVALRKSRFSATYRFTRTYRTTRYRFRAVIRNDRDFPYAAATSPVATVWVQP